MEQKKETVPLELQKYLECVYNEIAPFEKGVKKISQYGGSVFVIFNSGRTYRLTFQLYNSQVSLDGSLHLNL